MLYFRVLCKIERDIVQSDVKNRLNIIEAAHFLQWTVVYYSKDVICRSLCDGLTGLTYFISNWDVRLPLKTHFNDHSYNKSSPQSTLTVARCYLDEAVESWLILRWHVEGLHHTRRYEIVRALKKHTWR